MWLVKRLDCKEAYIFSNFSMDCLWVLYGETSLYPFWIYLIIKVYSVLQPEAMKLLLLQMMPLYYVGTE